MKDIYFRYLTIAACLLLSFLYLQIWISPDPNNAQMLFISFYVTFCEIALMHTGLVINLFSRRIIFHLLILFCIVCFFLVRNQFQPTPLFLVYLFIILLRLRFDFQKKTLDALSTHVIVSFKMMVICGLSFAFVSFFPLPSLGLTSDYLESIGYFKLFHTPYHRVAGRAEAGISIYQDPRVLVGFGFLYFATIAFLEYFTIKAQRSGQPGEIHEMVLDLLRSIFRNKK